MIGFLEDIGLSIIVFSVIGLVFYYLKQPMLLACLITGVIIGPSMGPKLVISPNNIDIISRFGLILLLFIIGLEMNPRSLMQQGKAIFVAGIGGFFVLVGLGFAFFTWMGTKYGIPSSDIVYLVIVYAISSTAIVIKILYDKGELDTIAGRITLGILIVQDVWAILILAFLPTFSNPDIVSVLVSLSKGILLLVGGFFLSRFVLKPLFTHVSKSPELVLAIALGWCAAIAGGANFAGLSFEMGALVAGLAIAPFPYSIHITSKLEPLRDFFLTLFFISIGMKIPFPDIHLMGLVGMVVIFVILSRFITIYPLLRFSGSSPRTSFITSLNLAQLGEFSLVIALLGVSYSHIQQQTLSLITYSMAITAVISSYCIQHSHSVYSLWFKLFHGSKLPLSFKAEESVSDESTGSRKGFPFVMLGYNRSSEYLIHRLTQTVPDILLKMVVVDYNLEHLKTLRAYNIKGIFGDFSYPETLRHIPIESAEVILLPIPESALKGISVITLVKTCRYFAPHAYIIALSESASHASLLKKGGADEVILSSHLIGGRLIELIESKFSGSM